jgi:hypothetical protein
MSSSPLHGFELGECGHDSYFVTSRPSSRNVQYNCNELKWSPKCSAQKQNKNRCVLLLKYMYKHYQMATKNAALWERRCACVARVRGRSMRLAYKWNIISPDSMYEIIGTNSLCCTFFQPSTLSPPKPQFCPLPPEPLPPVRRRWGQKPPPSVKMPVQCPQTSQHMFVEIPNLTSACLWSHCVMW